jgi:hypothetical protein
MNGQQVLENLKKKAMKIDITKLTRDSFETPALRAKYFRHDNRTLDRLHLPIMTKEVYEPIVQEEFNNPKMQKENLHFETASSYYIKKARLYVLAFDLGVNPKQLDSSNYIWNEDYFIHSNFITNINMVDDLFRENEADNREASANTVYIAQEVKCKASDTVLWDELFNFCYTAIITKKAMLLQKVSQCLSFLVSVQEYTYGFTENMTGAQVATLKNYITFFTELLSNEDALSFIKSTNDIEVFAKCEETHKDYIETYRTLIRRASGCAGDEVERFKSDLSYVYDPYLKEIITEDMDFEDFLSGSYLDNEGDEEDEAYINA